MKNSRMKFVSLFIVLVMLFSSNFAYASHSYGNWGYINNVNGYSYQLRSYTINLTSIMYGRTLIGPTPSSANPPIGYYGVQGRLYRDDGTLIASADWSYSSNSEGHGIDNGPNTRVIGTYYSQGRGRVWHGTGYWTYGSFRSPSQRLRG